MKITFPEDCGNAPKKQQLRDLMIALIQGSTDAASELMADGVVWEIVGRERLVGIDAVLKHFGAISGGKPSEFRIHQIITHGKTAALNATLTMNDGMQLEFCDVFEFTGASKTAKVKEVRSYRVA